MDSTGIQEQLLGLLGLVLAMGTAWLMKLARDFIKKQGAVADGKLSEQARDRLYPALQYAIAYGRAALSADDAAKLETSDKLKAFVVGQATSYVRTKLGGTLEQLGVTDQALEELLKARLQSALDYLKIPAAK